MCSVKTRRALRGSAARLGKATLRIGKVGFWRAVVSGQPIAILGRQEGNGSTDFLKDRRVRNSI